VPQAAPKVLALSLALIAAAALASAGTVVVIEYGQSMCPVCAEQKKVLLQLQERGLLDFLYVELVGNETNAREFASLCEALGLEYRVPLLVVVVDGRVRGVFSPSSPLGAEQLKDLVSRATGSRGILVLAGGSAYEVSDPSTVERVQRVVERRLRGAAAPSAGELSVSEVLAVLIPLAAADSVNPCTFALYATLLLMVLALGGVRRMLASALAFVAAVFAGYYLLGLGLVTVAGALPPIFTKVIAAAGLALGCFGVLTTLRGGFKSLVPRRLRRVTEGALDLAVALSLRVAGPLGSAGLGLLCSFTLLPCSSGPYVVFAGVLSRLGDRALRYLLLALYNLIFVAPLAALAVAVAALGLRAESLERLRGRGAQSIMGLVASSLLAAVCAWLLLTH